MNEERDVIGEVIAEDNARPIHPAVAEYAVRALHTATSDGERVAELELLNKELWRQNAQRDARIEEQAREIERLSKYKRFESLYAESERELAALKARPSGVLPERFEMEPYQTVDKGSTNYKAGFNAAVKQMRESLNSSSVSAGCVVGGKGISASIRGAFAEAVSAGGVDERAVELTRQVHQALGLSDSYLNTRDYGNGFARFKYDDVQRAFELIRAALSAGSAVPDGWLLVPKTLPCEMHSAFWNAIPHGPTSGIRVQEAWTAMLAAAPTAKKEG